MIKISQKSSHTEDNTIIEKSTFLHSISELLITRGSGRRRFYNSELQFISKKIPPFSDIPHDELLAYISEQARFIYRASYGEFSYVRCGCYDINTITKKLEDGDCNGYHAYYNGRVVIWR